MKKTVLFLLIATISFAQNAERKFISEKHENGYTKINVSDGTYYIKIISDKIVETSFVPKNETFNKNSDLVIPIKSPLFDIVSSNNSNEVSKISI